MNGRWLSPSRPPLLGLSLALLVTALVALAGQNNPATLLVLSPDAKRAIPLSVVGGLDMVSLDDLASLFQLAIRDERGALTVSYKGRTIVLTSNQAIASISGRLISLPAPPARVGNHWLVPLDFISRALLPIYDARLELRRTSRLLIVGDLRVPRITVRQEVVGAITRVTLESQPRSEAAVAPDGTGRLTVKFDADAIDVALPPGGLGLVQGIRPADPAGLVIDLGPGFRTFRTSTQVADAGTRLTVELLPSQVDPAPSAAADARAPVEHQGIGAGSAAIRTLTIDAGHGGDDLGAASADGAREKDVTLAVARRLKALVESRLGLRVLMTRDEDRAVGITERTALANNNKADVFVSLHANASFRPTVSGASIFVASFGKDAEAGLTPPVRLPAAGGGLRDIELLPWNLAQIRHRDRSEVLARLIAAQFQGRVPLAPQHIDHAPLRVLESANMAAVLIEMGYLTHREQAARLTGADFQNAIALGIVEALTRFRDAANAAEGAVR